MNPRARHSDRPVAVSRSRLSSLTTRSSTLRRLSWAAALGGLLAVGSASALPGLYIGSTGEPLKSHETHVVIMKGETRTAVTIATDYEGPMKPFAFIMPLPADVTTERFQTLKRGEIDRLQNMTAPRFHEFWEMDPCEVGGPEQIWQIDLRVKEGAANFLATPGSEAVQNLPKVAKELSIPMNPEFQEGGQTYFLFGQKEGGAGAVEQLDEWAKKEGYQLSAEQKKALEPYVAAGQQLLAVKVDAKRIELLADDRAQLAPFRFWTEQPYDRLPVTLGLAQSPGKQELITYVFGTKDRYTVKNYENYVPPTNVELDFKAKERMGEFYAALQDRIAEKHPKAFLVEYAWDTKGCGEPCSNSALGVSSLMTFGGDALEETLPEEVRLPKPPELTKEEQKAAEEPWKELKPAERAKKKKQFEEDRKEVARRKAIIERQQYILSRVHYRYDAKNLDKDPEFGPAAPLAGGTELPKGMEPKLATAAKEGGENRFQLRYNNFHPWAPKIECTDAKRGRWGKPPLSYRGLNKIWVAEDLSRRRRKEIDPAKVVLSPVPALGLTGVAPETAAPAPSASAEAATGTEATKSSCGCRVAGASGSAAGTAGWLALAAGLALALRRRRG